MNPDWLLKHFGQISEAPDAVPRLRRFILNLAVRGKLVEQDQADEPASELLKRIEQEKVRSNNAAGIRKTKPLQPTIGDDVPFSLPKTWLWARLGEVFDYDAGTKTEPKQLPKNAWLLELEDIEKDSGKIIQRFRVDERSPKSTKSGFHPGDVLYGKLRPYLNKAVVVDSPGFSTTEIVALRCYGESAPRYTCLAMRRPDFVDYVTRLGHGTKMPRLRTEDALSGLFPLPPLGEQHRIVAKVDELMTLCDELEVAQAKREKRRDRLVAATLHGLNNGDGSPEPGGHPIFEKSARFYFNHLPHLTTRPKHIQQLRQTILNLAVRGKLVWQDTKQQALTVESLEVPFYLPASWRWKTIGDLGKTQTGSTPPTVERQHYDGNIPFIKPAAISDGVINYEGQCLTESGVRESTLVHAGAILMVCIGGSIGKAALVTLPVCFNQQINSVSPTEGIDAHYLLFAMQSPYFRACVVNAAAQGTLPIISKGKWERLLIPVPPLAEQHQIVAKVDELMALCDELETHLTTTAATRRQLLEATLQEALIVGM